MSFFKGNYQKTCRGFAIITDWLLIVLGGLLITVAFRSIDVMIAKYLIVGCGIVFAGIGLQSRHRRRGKER